MTLSSCIGLGLGRSTAISKQLGGQAARKLPMAALCVAVLSGCAPDLGPAPTFAEASHYAIAKTVEAPEAPWPELDWWTVYGDAELDALEAEAIKGAPNLKAAEARFRSAAESVAEVRANLLPQISGDGSIQTTKQSVNQGFPEAFDSFLPHGYHTQTRLALDLDWQLDFFGRNRAALAAATSTAEAARADAAAAQLDITAGVAAAYAELVRLYADRDAAVDALRVRQQTLDLVRRRLSNGLETRTEFSQQAQTLPQARSDLVVIDRQILASRHQIAALMGEGPDRGLAIPRPPATRARALGLPAHLGADLMGRRADIVAAKLRAEAAAKRVKVARADFYPNVDLTGLYGVQSLGVNTLFQYGSVIGAIGPAIRLPIFSEGRLQGVYRGARAEYAVAVASYDATVARALQDVADAIAAQRALQAELAEAQSTRVLAEDAFRGASLRYQGGLSGYLSVLTAENSLVAARRNLADLDAQALSLDVALVRALGGGYAEPTRLAAADR